MNLDLNRQFEFTRWRQMPILREFFLQWRNTRASVASNDFQKPFSRNWETLLEDAGLISAETRREADRDARTLAGANFLILKTAKYRSYQIERITLPFASEPLLRTIYADELSNESETKFDLASITWEVEMQFVKSARCSIDPQDLLQLNEFLRSGGRERPIVPIKERSFSIFGDEKRLDALLTSSLFRPDRLTLEALRCEIVGEPLAWKRGPAEAAGKPIMVIENAATWHSYCRWNASRHLFSAIVYGCGNRFVDGIRYLNDVFSELGGPRRVFYFGDLDPPGLRIPQLASAYVRSSAFPVVEPHLWSYRELLSRGLGKESVWDGEPALFEDCAWLGDLRGPAWEVLSNGKRLAQECVGWDFLMTTQGPAS